MRISFELPCEDWLKAVKKRMGSFTDLGQERFTGIIIGRFFSITHHAGYEYNRRITNERNNAIGYIKKTAEGSEVRCIRTMGTTTPQALLLLFLLFSAFCLAMGVGEVSLGAVVLISLGTTILAAFATASFDSITKRGSEGKKQMYALLVEPTNPFAHLDIS